MIILYITVCCLNERGNANFVVMTFNTWVSGTNVVNGTMKIVSHIKRINPDVVALQEVYNSQFMAEILSCLGIQWSGALKKDESYPDTAILTRHQLSKEPIHQLSHGLGTRIYIPKLQRNVSIWNLHLDYRSYGPYAAFNKLVTKKSQIRAGELLAGGRFENIRELLSNTHFYDDVKNADAQPVIVCGDFNSPSHLDWTNETKSIHGDWEFTWPATKILQTLMIDSYRQVHPDVIKHPGITWSTVEKMSSAGWQWSIPEPQDRIDFIFYRGQSLKPVNSYAYQGKKVVHRKPYHKYNDYPSDHFAVITVFELK
ncbi:unnamed protein product [Thelazia callipaeda]|uniref:Endo/exonuclease/phosphatase domain-containing protein n=1 Tax=Thelazia callipaeda TaxID=103827 RepID=A0A0N5DBD8_THECL|nr:unnamed protein product [Thelazia callipaeda]